MIFDSCTVAGLGPLLLPEVRCNRGQRPWWEAARLHSMHHYLGPGDRLLDVGAEMGDLSALFASWGIGMFLVEPNPKSWPFIGGTFDANNLRQRVHGWYVGLVGSYDQELASRLEHPTAHAGNRLGDLGWPVFVNLEPDEATGFFSLAEHMDVSPVTTIDGLMLASNFAPTAITMDIEGGEYDALAGALATLTKYRPKVWVSIHPGYMADQYGHTKEQVLDMMIAAQYDPVFLATDHEEHWMFLPREYGWKY